MKIPIVFGKRDQEKYKQVIQWLSSIDDGWKNQAVKDALLSYVTDNQLGLTESYESTQTVKTIPTPPKPKPLKTQPFIAPIANDYQELVITPPTEEKVEEADLTNINRFLDGDF